MELILNIHGIFLMIFRYLSANFQISSCKFSDFFLQIFTFHNMAILGQKGCFRALLGPPGDISGWSKRLKLTPPDVKYNVQPCSTNVQLIWACWDCLWPKWPFRAKKDISGASVVSRPQDDLCSLYLYFCVDHLSTQIAKRQGTAMY